MNNFAIIPDSSCDLTKDLRARFGIEHMIRGTVYLPSGDQIPSDIDWENITPEEYYNSMRGRKILYKTATPPVGEIQEVFERALSAGKDILSISLSTGISGTYQLVQNLSSELLQKYPERKIICIDSLRYSSAEAVLVTLACAKRDAGASLEETADFLNDIKHCIHQIGALDDLFFCAKTGRITNYQAFFGTLIGVNSLADFSRKGLSSVLGKVKGKQASLDVTLRYVEKTIRNSEDQIIFIGHSNREESARFLEEKIREKFNPKDVIINPIGMTCGASIGPGLCAVYYLGDPIAEDEAVQRKVFEELLKK